MDRRLRSTSVEYDKVVLPPLPEPGSEDLAELVPDAAAREIYALLHRRQASPPTMVEIRAGSEPFSAGPTSADAS